MSPDAHYVIALGLAYPLRGGVLLRETLRPTRTVLQAPVESEDCGPSITRQN